MILSKKLALAKIASSTSASFCLQPIRSRKPRSTRGRVYKSLRRLLFAASQVMEKIRCYDTKSSVRLSSMIPTEYLAQFRKVVTTFAKWICSSSLSDIGDMIESDALLQKRASKCRVYLAMLSIGPKAWRNLSPFVLHNGNIHCNTGRPSSNPARMSKTQLASMP